MTLGFRQFEQRGQARIYLDMDGVLCDFIKGVKDTTGEDFTSPDLCLLYTSPSPRDRQKSRMPSSA